VLDIVGHVTLPAPHAPRSPDAKYVHQVEAKVPRFGQLQTPYGGRIIRVPTNIQNKKKKNQLIS